HGDADHTLEQPLPHELAPAGARVPVQRRAAGQQIDNRCCRELRAAQRAVDPLAGEWIEAIGGIPDQQGAAAPGDGTTRPAGERSRGKHAAHEVPRLEASRDPWKTIELLEESRAAPS